MRKFLTLADGHTVELSPLSYEEFMCLDHWSGGSDLAFAQWLRHNNFEEASSYRDEVLADACFWIDPTALPAMQFNVGTKATGDRWMEYQSPFNPDGTFKARYNHVTRTRPSILKDDDA